MRHHLKRLTTPCFVLLWVVLALAWMDSRSRDAARRRDVEEIRETMREMRDTIRQIKPVEVIQWPDGKEEHRDGGELRKSGSD